MDDESPAQLRATIAELRTDRDSESHWANQYKKERDEVVTALLKLVKYLRANGMPAEHLNPFIAICNKY